MQRNTVFFRRDFLRPPQVSPVWMQNMAGLGFYNRGVTRRSFVVPTTILRKGIPCGLLETCFIDSSSDMRRYAGDRQAVADAIASGIANGLGLIDG